MRGWKLPVCAALATAVVLASPSLVAAATVPNGYHITVAPTSQDAGQSVTVTGDGQFFTPPFSGDNCDSVSITVTVTYFTQALAQKTATSTLGTSDGNGDLSGSVTIPADAGPTSFTGHTADVQASCDVGSDTFLSQVVPVTILGTVTPPTTVPTTAPAAVPTAPAAAPVTAQPKLTG